MPRAVNGYACMRTRCSALIDSLAAEAVVGAMGAIYYFAYATVVATILILADERQAARPWLETIGVFI